MTDQKEQVLSNRTISPATVGRISSSDCRCFRKRASQFLARSGSPIERRHAEKSGDRTNYGESLFEICQGPDQAFGEAILDLVTNRNGDDAFWT